MKLRIRFSKTGRARYLSHLDVMRVLQRSLTRSGAPVEYSEGFNPHMKLSVLLPLPLGLESVCELCDVKIGNVNIKQFIESLNAALPEGFEATDARPASRGAQDIAWAAYDLIFERAEGYPDNAAQALTNLTGQGPLTVEKKTKKGVAETDIAAFVKGAVWERTGRHTVRCRVTLPAQNPSLNPGHMADALRRAAPQLAPDAVYGVRAALFDAKGEVFE